MDLDPGWLVAKRRRRAQRDTVTSGPGSCWMMGPAARPFLLALCADAVVDGSTPRAPPRATKSAVSRGVGLGEPTRLRLVR